MVQFAKTLSCSTCAHKSHFFMKMNEKELDLINKNRIEVRFRKGDVIVKQGTSPTHLIYMIDGLGKLYIEGSNANVTLQLLTPRTYVSLESVFSDDVFSDNLLLYSVAAIEDSRACFIDLNIFKQIVRTNSAFCYELMCNISNKSNQYYNKIRSITQKNSRGRLADSLLYLSEIYGTLSLNLTLTRKDLAELAGTSLENSIRILSEFKKENIINLEGRHIEIVNLEFLKKIRELG